MTEQSAQHGLASAEKTELKLGYVPLTDSAPLVIAQELGYFAEYGLDVMLERQGSWANIRDKIAAGYLDAAQMLAPMLLTTTLGLGGIRTPLMTGLCLSSNGNAITLNNELAEQIADTPSDGVQEHAFASDMDSAKRAAARLAERVKSGLKLTLATVHPFSTHSLLLRVWLRAGGIDPDRDLRIIVLPPGQMVDSLSRGIIDGYCVGEPWNTRATQFGIGAIVATGYQVWNNAPEKALGVTQAWHAKHPATHLRLRLALMKAAAWLDEPENRSNAARILAHADYLNLPEKELLPSLTGEICFSRKQPPTKVDVFHQFSNYHTGFPWRSQAAMILEHVEHQIGKDISAERKQSLIQECYQPHLYREAARELGWSSPDQDIKQENSHPTPWETDQGLHLGADLVLGRG